MGFVGRQQAWLRLSHSLPPAVVAQAGWLHLSLTVHNWKTPGLAAVPGRAGIARSSAVNLLVAPPELVFFMEVLQSSSSATFVSVPNLVLNFHRQ